MKLRRGRHGVLHGDSLEDSQEKNGEERFRKKKKKKKKWKFNKKAAMVGVFYPPLENAVFSNLVLFESHFTLWSRTKGRADNMKDLGGQLEEGVEKKHKRKKAKKKSKSQKGAKIFSNTERAPSLPHIGHKTAVTWRGHDDVRLSCRSHSLVPASALRASSHSNYIRRCSRGQFHSNKGWEGEKEKTHSRKGSYLRSSRNKPFIKRPCFRFSGFSGLFRFLLDNAPLPVNHDGTSGTHFEKKERLQGCRC